MTAKERLKSLSDSLRLRALDSHAAGMALQRAATIYELLGGSLTEEQAEAFLNTLGSEGAETCYAKFARQAEDMLTTKTKGDG